jgi:hypothetical protein
MKSSMFILLACLLFNSCVDHEDSDSSDLDGTWKLVSTSGTITGNGITTDWNKIVIEDAECTFFKDAKSIESSGLTFVHDHVKDIHKVTFVFTNKAGIIIDLKNDPDKNYKLDGKKLSLISDCCNRVNYELMKE